MTRKRPAKRDEVAVRDFVEHMAMTFAEWGFPRMSARVLFTLMTIDRADGLTAAELAEQLEVSPAAISGAVRQLITVGLVRRMAVPGSRRDRYRLPDDPWYTATITKNALIAHVAEQADEVVDALGGARTPAGQRVAEMGEFFEFVLGEMDGLLDRWHASRRQTA